MLHLTDLRLLRGRTVVLDAFSGLLLPGHGAWVVGPNGAGKSSLLRAIAGLLSPLSGSITRPDNLIYIGTQHGHDAQLTARDNLRFWASLHSAPLPNVDGLLAEAGLAAQADKQAGDLSAGQQQRLALARLLITRSPLWLLDEPTSALDSAGQAWVAGLISQQLVDGGAVLCATHAPLDLPSLDIWTLSVSAGAA